MGALLLAFSLYKKARTADQQALDFQLNDNNEFSTDDIFSMPDQQNSIEDDDLLENFTEDDAFLNGDWF